MRYGVYEEWMNDIEPCRYPGKKVESDTERRLQWWENVVLKVVPKLLAGNVSQASLIRGLIIAGLTEIEMGGGR